MCAAPFELVDRSAAPRSRRTTVLWRPPEDRNGKLKAPPHRITLPDAPVPYNGGLEARYLPSAGYVTEQVAALVSTNKAPAPWWRNAA